MRFLKNRKFPEDAGLMSAVARGDEAAFRELLKRHQPRVLNFACRFLGDSDEARDVAQETFLRVYRSAKGYKPMGGLKSYVLTIARNLCLDLERKKRPELMDNLPDRPDEDTPLDILRRKEGMDALAEAIRDLPESQRSAVILRHTQGLSYDEIAKVMAVTVPAVESLLVRGRKKLRARLAEYDVRS